MYKRTKIEAEVHPRFLCLEEFMNYRYQLHVLAVGIPDDNHVVDMRDTQVRLG